MINKFVDVVVAHLFWIATACFFLGLGFGGSAAWWWQDIRFNALNRKYTEFVSNVTAIGEETKKNNDLKKIEEQKKKLEADDEYQSNIDHLRADVKRLQDARSSRHFLPAPSPVARDPDVTCIERAEFERTLQHLDGEVQDLITTGDEARIALNNARSWANDVYQTTMHSSK